MQVTNELLTIDEAAAMLRTPVATLRYWRHLGNLGPRSFKLGRRVLYDAGDVRDWIERTRAEQLEDL
jgi:excisionase family DNA binding protein